MVDQGARRKEIERQFTSLESYWGFDIDEVEGLKSIKGIEVFSQLSDTEQLRVLGPTKCAALKENKFVFSDLVGRKYDPQWGWTRYEKSLNELIGAEQAKGTTRLALASLGWEGGFSVDTGKSPTPEKMLENARSTHLTAVRCVGPRFAYTYPAC
jgi:hypothetical protein